MFPQRAKFGDEGFSLLEMLVVIAIAAMIVAAAPAVYGRLIPAYQVRQFSNDLVDDLRQLRELARSEGTEQEIRLEQESGALIVQGVSLFAPHDTKVSIEPEPMWEASPNNRIVFYPEGTSSGGTITLRRGDLDLFIQIDWVSGTVTVQQ